MNLKDILSSEMAQAELDKRNARKAEIAEQFEENKRAFEKSDLEARESLLKANEDFESEVKVLDEEIAELEEHRAKLADVEERMSLLGNVKSEKVEERKKMEVKDRFDTPEYRHAYVEWLKTGDNSELRALTTDLTNAPVPTILADEIETAWAEYGKISNMVSVVQIKGIFETLYEASATGAVWHDEGSDAPTEQEITLGTITITPKMIKKWISWTDELEALADDMLLRYIGREVPHYVIQLLDNAILTRTDSDNKGVIGIVGNDNAVAVTQELSFNAVNVALAELSTWENITVVMNPATFFNNVMGLVDTTGRPIYQVMTDNAGKPRYYFGGYPVEFTDALEAYSASSTDPYMIVGNFKGYKLNLPQGKQVITVTDRVSLSREDKVYLVGRLFAGGNITKQGHFAVVSATA